MTRSKDIKTPEYIMEKLDCTYEEALDVIEYDKKIAGAGAKPVSGEVVVEKSKAKKKTGIEQEELDKMYDIIVAEIGFEAFQNKHISSPVGEALGLSNRQTPSRLKRMVEQGMLEEVAASEVKLAGKTSAKAYRALEK